MTRSLSIASIINSKTLMRCTTDNINTAEHSNIVDIDTNTEYQFVRQFWSTNSDIENYWYIDQDHVLELTDKSFNLYLRKSELDNWNGNKWELIDTINRGEVLNSNVIKYFAASSFNSSPVFICLSVQNSKTIHVDIYDMLKMYEVKIAYNIGIEFVPLGEGIGEAISIKSYMPTTAETVLSNSKFSASVIANTLLFGIALDKGLNQWTVQLGLDVSSQNVICGYGFVGYDGTLTGGEIPEKYFDIAKGGFTGIVYPLDKLASWSSIVGWEDIIVGTQTQQWYISKNISKIISHVKCNSATGLFTPVAITVNNNYVEKYTSTSFASDKIQNYIPQAMSLDQIIPMPDGMKSIVHILTKIFLPSVWYYAPAWTKFTYLQQSYGQYAYVWNTVNYEKEKNVGNEDSAARAASDNKDILRSDELTFDKKERSQEVTQEQAYTKSAVGGFLITLLTQGISAISAVTADVIVNRTNGMNTNDEDKNKKYSQFFVANALATTASDTTMKGFNADITAKVQSIKSLDMFYSTSANSHCYAGPGFVIHNFVANCVAQSVSNRYIQANQNMMFTIIEALSIIELELKNRALKVAQKLCDGLAEIASNMSGIFKILGKVAAVAAFIASEKAKKDIENNNMFIELVPKLLSSFKLSQGASFSQLGAISEHRIDIEGKHKYGSKNVTMMWPCYGANNVKYTNEAVTTDIETVDTNIDFSAKNFLHESTDNKFSIEFTKKPIANVTSTANDEFKRSLNGKLYSEFVYCKGISEQCTAPDGMAVIEGVESFLPQIPFKNENISVGDPAFTQPFVHDFILNKFWKLGITAINGEILWVSCKDTKLFDGAYSNIVASNNFCCIASPCGAVEIKNALTEDYNRPYAVTPNTIALNCTGINAIHDNKAYHAFDGVGQRIVEWHGSSGLDKQHLTYQYCFQVNDHFKRSNILPPAQFLGNFAAPPLIAVESRDKIYNSYSVLEKNIGIMNDIPGENRNLYRYSIPVFTDQISTLPAVVKTLSAYKLNVVEGITSLTTDLRSTQTAYKAPDSVDFAIDGVTFRATDEFVCTLNNMNGTVTVKDIVATMGLKYIGATPFMAFFYSPATRAYYSFTSNGTIAKEDVWNRFRNITNGKWDFVNQEVIFSCLANMTRLDTEIQEDDNETDNIMICRMGNRGIIGEVTPPNMTIFNNESWFKLLSMPGGLCYQGPKRFIVNRFVLLDHMIDNINSNTGKWKRLSRETFHPFRKYKDVNGDYAQFEAIDDNHDSGPNDIAYAVKGWTHNPFVFVTSPLGISEAIDCKYEWEITFTWTEEMDKLYKGKKYMCINIAAQTMCPGGKLTSRPTHLYLTKDMFTRSNNSGYYSFRYQSNNGAGNREQLFIWSDSYIAMCGLEVEIAPVTENRNTQLTQQIDIQDYEEM